MNTLSGHGTLLHFQQIGASTYALRYSGGPGASYTEIRDTMKAHDKQLWRWDDTLNNGQGAWRVDRAVLESLRCYFPLVDRALRATVQLEELFTS